MWIVEFCARHSSDCVQMAEECTDAERRRAWLQLAQRWVLVADDVRASDRGGHQRGDPGDVVIGTS